MNRYIFLPLLFFLLFPPAMSLADHTVGFLIPVSGLGDQSFNDMTYAGLIRAKNYHTFNLVREKSTANDKQSRKRAMEKLINKGADIIVSNGWEFNTIINDYARKHPDKYFIINDYPLAGLPNVISTVFDQHEGSFLAGALAAWTTQTGKIGFIGGKDMPVIRAFLTGYREGARYARDDIVIDVVFLSEKDDTGAGFDSPERGFTAANDMFAHDVDIIFSVAGLSGNGIIRAAAQNGKYAIGVDADQDHMAKGHVLTSMIKRLDKATFEALKIILEGNFKAGIYSFGLEENGVALSPMTYTHHLIPQEVHEKLNMLKKKIIAREIVVTNTLNAERDQ